MIINTIASVNINKLLDMNINNIKPSMFSLTQKNKCAVGTHESSKPPPLISMKNPIKKHIPNIITINNIIYIIFFNSRLKLLIHKFIKNPSKKY